MSKPLPETSLNRNKAVRFIVLLGLVSLFADMTYESARSITGQYMALLGASAAAIATVSGLGEFLGYALRLLSGYLADRTGRYWALTIAGYAVNLLAVPAMALAGHWEIAALLIILERSGKALRAPARDAMLSHASSTVGQGWGFGLHEAMDQIGAMVGPLIVSLVLYIKGDYRYGFAALLLPALLALTVLLLARYLFPRPHDLEPKSVALDTRHFSRYFWLYLAAVALIAAGYADFPLIAYHFKMESVAPENWLPGLYALAMGVDALSALFFGRLFDRIGIMSLVFAAMASAFFAPLVFLGGLPGAILGMIAWGIGMGAQESVMRAFLASMVSSERRGTAYGLFNTGYGLFWFLGSALMGFLYGMSVPVLVGFSIIAQLAAISLFLFIRSHMRTVHN